MPKDKKPARVAKSKPRKSSASVLGKRKMGGLLAAIIESSEDAIISKNMEGEILSWNAAAETLLGYQADEAIGQPITMIVPKDRLQEERRIISCIKHGKKVEHFETLRMAKGGQLIDVSLTVSPIFNDYKQVIGASKILRDIRERKEAEKVHDQLRHIQKMESLGQLTGGIAHDFNNLLAIILGNLDFMAAKVGPHDPLQTFIRPSIEAAEHGAELTKQLLSFGRKQTLQPKTISLNELLRSLSILLQRTLGENIKVVLALHPELWNVHADPSQLQNALLNLAVNARDAMPNGGTLTFETKNASLDEAYAHHNVEVVPGNYAVVSVSDTGEGMTQAVMEKAFEPFFTTKDVGKGSGLGLSMVYGFVKQSKGHIKIYSEPGCGTSVKIYLPRSEDFLAMPEHDKGNVISINKKPTLVLVVEDNRDVLKLTSSMVEECGYRVIQAKTGEAALKILETRSDIGLLLTDISLQGALNGPALAKSAVALCPGLKVLFNSGCAQQVIVQEGLVPEAVHLIGKPFRKQQLAAKIKEVMK